jgi:hypothetical protein
MVCGNFGPIVIYPSLGADDGGSWQFVTAIDDDQDGPKLCEQVSGLYQQSSWCYLKCFVAEISRQSSWIRWKDRFRVQSSEDPRMVIWMECRVYFCQGCNTSKEHTRSALHIWGTCKGGHLWRSTFGLKLGGSNIKGQGSGSSCKQSLNDPHYFFLENPVS